MFRALASHALITKEPRIKGKCGAEYEYSERRRLVQCHLA